MTRRRRVRQTLLKIRAVPLVRMPKSRFFKLIRQACRKGVIPEDIRLTTLDWQHGRGRQYAPGSILSARDAEELRNCYDLLTSLEKADLRVERPE